jgi:hypothetical protein
MVDSSQPDAAPRAPDATVRAVADVLFHIMRSLVYALVELELAAEFDQAALADTERDKAGCSP